MRRTTDFVDRLEIPVVTRINHARFLRFTRYRSGVTQIPVLPQTIVDGAFVIRSRTGAGLASRLESWGRELQID